MSENLEQILIFASGADFKEQITQLHKTMVESARFGIDTDQYQTVVEILRDVATNGNEALIQCTNRYDNVCITSTELRVNKDELKAAHAQIDKSLLQSLRGAIENV